MANSVKGGMPNEGKTDTDRGKIDTFTFSKERRDTGKVGSAGSQPNSNKVDSNKTTNSDPRLS